MQRIHFRPIAYWTEYSCTAAAAAAAPPFLHGGTAAAVATFASTPTAAAAASASATIADSCQPACTSLPLQRDRGMESKGEASEDHEPACCMCEAAWSSDGTQLSLNAGKHMSLSAQTPAEDRTFRRKSYGHPDFKTFPRLHRCREPAGALGTVACSCTPFACS